MFWTRLFSGIILLVIAIGSIWLGGPVLTAVLLVVSLIGYRELTKALGVPAGEKKTVSVESAGLKTSFFVAMPGLTAIEIVGLAGTVLYYGVLQLCLNTEHGMMYWDSSRGAVWLLGCIVLVFMAQLFVYVFAFPKYQAEQVIAGFFAFVYAPVMLSFVEMARMIPGGIIIVWLILISSWGCDTCAYAVGKLIGKRKIFPVLSPKKSLEGCIGGVLGAALLGFIYGKVLVNLFPATVDTFAWQAALVCAVGAIMSMVGDLAASAIKRNKGIKDYGRLIPGHGGIMDRFDSVIVTAPLVYFMTLLLIGH
ncbi:MAG: phosphatidate cytidylyltransferase [Acetatifactor sp.]|nr:phosphatidate cytidylyltransferase [Acetatifactor sp.]